MNHIGTRTLATERLTLRRFEPEDAEQVFYNWQRDPEVTKYLTWKPYQAVEDTGKKLQEWASQYSEDNFYMWAIELGELEQPIGSISAVKLAEEIDGVEIGYCIGRAFWHQGYATEALREVIRFFMEEVGASRVWAEHDIDNPNSGKVMQAAGMTFEGILRKAGRNNQGICDMAVYAKVRDEESEEEIPQEEAGAVVEKVLGEDGKLHNVVSDETIEYVGILAKLDLSGEEVVKAREDMARMLDYIDELNELDTSGIESMTHIFEVSNVFREDVVSEHDGSAATLQNAPAKKDGGFVVPKTIGE